MRYSSTDHSSDLAPSDVEPPFETVVSTISRCAGYVALALATAGLFMIVF